MRIRAGAGVQRVASFEQRQHRGRIKKALAFDEGLKGSDETEFRKGPEETTIKRGL